MSNPRRLGFAFLAAILGISFLVCASANSARAQEPEPASSARGIQLYLQGDASGAAKVLTAVVKKHPDDADAWYYLGLAYHSQGWIGAARRPFERVVELRPDSADAHAKLSYALILGNEPQKAIAMAERAIELGDQSAEPHYAIAEASLRSFADPLLTKPLEMAVEEADRALKVNPNFSLALITKSFAHYKLKQYSEATASLEKFLELNPNDADAETWRGQLTKTGGSESTPPTTPPFVNSPILSPREVTQKAHVLTKPEPQYTEAARKAAVVGTVILRAVFASDGQVKNLRVTQALPFGLTTEAVRAARKIKFTPAIKDGNPVSMYIQLEYNFNLF